MPTRNQISWTYCQGVNADPDKVEAIPSNPVLTNLKEVQRFLGLAGWYHKTDFSKIAQPLNDLVKNGRPFIWNEARQHAFDQLKSSLSSPPILPFLMYTDISDTGLGAVLTQKTMESKWFLLMLVKH